MYITGFVDIQKSNFLMTDDELHRWQDNAIARCEYDNYLNRLLEHSDPPVSEVLEESAINMAIESHGITPNRAFNSRIPNCVSNMELACDYFSSFDQRAISVAIELQGLGFPPSS